MMADTNPYQTPGKQESALPQPRPGPDEPWQRGIVFGLGIGFVFVCGFGLFLIYAFSTMLPAELSDEERRARIVAKMLSRDNVVPTIFLALGTMSGLVALALLLLRVRTWPWLPNYLALLLLFGMAALIAFG